MKHIVFLTLVLALLFLQLRAQVSINLGLISRMQPAATIAVEKQLGWQNTQAAVMASYDNPHPVISLQTGLNTDRGLFHHNYRLMAGAFYHTGITPVYKLEKVKQVRFGGSIRTEYNNGLLTMEYNGETLSVTVGFLFKNHHQ